MLRARAQHLAIIFFSATSVYHPGMRLTDLSPRFQGTPYIDDDGHEIHPKVETLAEAAGILFLCPVCFEKNGGPVGTHAILCWNGTVPAEFSPGPGRWDMKGTGFEDLTLVGAVREGKKRSNSVKLSSKKGCRAHFHVTDGRIK